MKKTKRLGVIYHPLNISTTLLVNGGSLSQTHCAETGESIPDREITPLVIVPQVYVNDPNGIIANGLVQLSDIKWYAIPQDAFDEIEDLSFLENELSKYLIGNDDEESYDWEFYSVGTDGSLTVSINTSYLGPVVLVFTGNYFDRRSGKVLRIQATATMSSTSIAMPATLTLDKPASWQFNPMESSRFRSITASLRIGGTPIDTEQYTDAYWWYKVENGKEILINNNEDLFYYSGQYGRTLTIDPRYIDGSLRIVCKAEYEPEYEIEMPDMPTDKALSAETVIVWRYPEYDFENFVHGGVDVPSTADSVKNECVVTIGKQVLESPSQFFSVKWSIRRAVYGAEWITLGYGDSIQIPASEFADGADVGLEIEEIEPLGALTEDDVVLCENDYVITL